MKLSRTRKNSGQTLIAAMIILGVLMIVGFVFLGIINRNIFQSKESKQRSQSYDLAQAGIRYAQSQLLNSPEGADWRPIPTLPFSNVDPDYEYLFPDPDANPANGDQGGPDGLGAYTRVNYGTGRFLVRARYAPSDAVLFSTAQNGPLRQPGRVRDYLVIESVGRIGAVNPQDPTTIRGKDSREFTKLIAFASIGIIESAMFITGSDRSSNSADLGMDLMGVSFEGTPVDIPWMLGSTLPMYNFGNPPTPTVGRIGEGGGVFSNVDLILHGRTVSEINQNLGDGWLVAGTIKGANNNASLTINRWNWTVGPGWQTDVMTVSNASAPSLDSRSNVFSTDFGVLRDAMDGTDEQGYWRSVGPKAPPSILRTDPETGLTRYYQYTRNSGAVVNGRNAGGFGYGSGVYVNNSQDRQMRADEEGREGVGSAESLVYDWFHPNNGQANSGWVGPYYIPRGAYLQFEPEGFVITRDSRSTGPEHNWRRPDGSDSGVTTIRYRVGMANGKQYIISTFTPGVNIGDANPNFALGRPFNGVLYFEGNVRVRGPIPTDVQLTVVSNATIYIEGSITKGIVRNHVTDPTGPPSPAERLNRPSRSMLMLMSKDYVVLNPTMFFGPGLNQALEEVTESSDPVAWNPLRVRNAGGTFTFRAEPLWDPNSGSGPGLPNTWLSFIEGYKDSGAPGSALKTKLILSHAMDDGAAPYTFMSLYVNYGLPLPDYFFAMVSPNSAASFFLPQPYGAIYGLGGETWQRYPKFETIGFDLLDPAVLAQQNNGATLRANTAGTAGDYSVLLGEPDDFTLRHNQVGFGATNDYLLARAALLPFDVRIEAAMFAEQGSFVVIPGNWFNPNPNDVRGTPSDSITSGTFLGNVNKYQQAPYNLPYAQAVARATAERQENFGSGPDMPFFAEPLDIKISIFGAISQNMPLPMSYQAEWQRKWGWIPRQTGFQWDAARSAPMLIPTSHSHPLFDVTAGAKYVPNLILTYDPGLATATYNGFGGDYLRRDAFGRPLPPMPALPVSPVLSYFGEVIR